MRAAKSDERAERWFASLNEEQRAKAIGHNFVLSGLMINSLQYAGISCGKIMPAKLIKFLARRSSHEHGPPK